MTNPVGGALPLRPIVPEETLSGEEAPIFTTIPRTERPDSLTISSRDMGKLTAEFCSYDGDSSTALEMLKNASKVMSSSGGSPYGNPPDNQGPPSELDEMRDNKLAQFYNNFILLASEPKQDWCKGGVSSGGWPYRSQSTNAPAYTLNKGIWSMAMFLPWENSDTYSFCKVHNDYIQTARRELPDEVRVMIEKQAEVNGFKDYDETKKESVPWNAERVTAFSERLNACVETMKGKALYVDYGGRKYDLKEFCLDVMKEVSPSETVEDKPTGSYARWGNPPEDTEKTPVGRLEALLDERLLDVKWNRWMEREDFCSEVNTKWGYILLGVVKDLVAILGTAFVWYIRVKVWLLIQKVFFNPGKGLIKKLGDLKNRIKDWWNKDDGNPPAPTGTNKEVKADEGSAAPADTGLAKSADAGKAGMSVVEQELAPLGFYVSDIKPTETPVPLWRRLGAGVRGWLGVPGNWAGAFGAAQAGARVYLGAPAPVFMP